ncbi:hypothetical protein [Xanthomonas vesicatoria]|uniref:hypothetical protein n=1 Tax=Xanthomonas vesicatoria TaxID=56460 RepID=UPI0007321F01|nr:hypothetical protein [Xanthomonas vesicatoria]KTF31104.1 hypothetical protein LMG919_20095 [Xanthomonas vesicatoria]MCC8559243.1 hypothetical protein [Xanthomonas vesicatoria]MCC8602195.1 hypothetical protein [Xanthomonas vesicatoria]MCC8610791.1 hypothetical protein [Xanthomonas vesicatoria]MCC8674896.1 hypothetical protein [Xanthomonas vesicatoria]
MRATIIIQRIYCRVRDVLLLPAPAAITAAACGSVITILLIDPRLLGEMMRSERTADWGSALGSLGAVAIALHLAGSAKRESNSMAHARSDVALRLLWPDLRRYQAALKRISRHSIINEPLGKAKDLLRVQRILGQLGRDLELVLGLTRELSGSRLSLMSQAIAHMRHVERHVTDLLILSSDRYISVNGWTSKQAAVRKSAKEAQKRLDVLIEQAAALVV